MPGNLLLEFVKLMRTANVGFLHCGRMWDFFIVEECEICKVSSGNNCGGLCSGRFTMNI